jgi:hypothetical protein
LDESFITIVHILLQYGADINHQDSDGNSLLHMILFDQVNHNRKNDTTTTTMGYIVQFMLQDCNADYLTIQNQDGKTVWDIAREAKKNIVPELKILTWSDIPFVASLYNVSVKKFQ